MLLLGVWYSFVEEFDFRFHKYGISLKTQRRTMSGMDSKVMWCETFIVDLISMFCLMLILTFKGERFIDQCRHINIVINRIACSVSSHFCFLNHVHFVLNLKLNWDFIHQTWVLRESKFALEGPCCRHIGTLAVAHFRNVVEVIFLIILNF